MAIDIKTSFYRYILSAFDILIPGKEPFDASTYVTAMFIEKDYDNDMFPVFGVGIDLNFIRYYDIVENKSTVKFRVKLDRYEYDNTADEDQVKYRENVFDSLFGIYIDDDSAFLNKDMYNEATSSLAMSENETLQTYEFYLFIEEDLAASKTIINSVIGNCTMTDGAAYLLSQSGSKRVLMSPMDNIQRYSEVLLPPLPTWKNILYLEEQYGFYKYGTLYFYDHDRTYFIDRGPDCTAWANGEIKNVTMTCLKSTKNDVLLPGTYINKAENTYELKIFMNLITMKSHSIQEDQITATDVTVINPKDGNIVEIHPDIDARIGNKTFVVNNYNNPYLNNMIEYNKYQNDHILDAQLFDIDVCCLSPNKRFNFAFEDKSVHAVHGGVYRLSSSFFKFDLLSAGEFSVSATAEFKKSK